MFFLILYTSAGIYLFLLIIGVVHRNFFDRMDDSSRGHARLAMSILSAGLIILGIYYGYFYLVEVPEINRQQQEEMLRFQQGN